MARSIQSENLIRSITIYSLKMASNEFSIRQIPEIWNAECDDSYIFQGLLSTPLRHSLDFYTSVNPQEDCLHSTSEQRRMATGSIDASLRASLVSSGGSTFTCDGLDFDDNWSFEQQISPSATHFEAPSSLTLQAENSLKSKTITTNISPICTS